VRVVNFNPNNGNANVNNDNANNRNDNRGAVLWLRDYMLCTDFSHPPSILPISCASDCIWKTLVSLTNFSSSIKRNLSVKTSRVPLDFNKQAAFIVFGASKRNKIRTFNRLNLRNISSYYGVVS